MIRYSSAPFFSQLFAFLDDIEYFLGRILGFLNQFLLSLFKTNDDNDTFNTTMRTEF